jgi:hypothetical protein
MSTLKADTVTTKSDDTDLTITGGGTGVPNLEAGFKVGGSAGVPTASIQDDAVTLAKLAAGTDGELITWDASGDPATVAVGTATHVLTSNGAGAAPTFQAAAGGGSWTYITTVTASAAATADFTSQLSSTYGLYMISAVDVHPATDEVYTYARFGVGATYETGAEYTWVSNLSYPPNQGTLYVDGISNTSTYMSLHGFESGGDFTAGNGADESSAFNLWIPNPAGTTYNHLCWWEMQLGNGNNQTSIIHGAGGLTNSTSATAAQTSIQFYMSSGNISGTFRLYGLATS